LIKQLFRGSNLVPGDRHELPICPKTNPLGGMRKPIANGFKESLSKIKGLDWVNDI
jgi:hypothetical protein